MTTLTRCTAVALLALGLVGAAFASVPATARALAGNALEISSTRLFESPKGFDGTVVELWGEAIGERLVRGPFTWISLNDDSYATKDSRQGTGLNGFNSGIALWVPTTLAERIDAFGDHRNHGTVIRVVGEFHAACPMHGGDTDVHVTSLYVVQPGAAVADPVRPGKLVLAIVLGLMALGAALLERRVRHRRY